MADTFIRWPELPVFRRKTLWHKIRKFILFFAPVIFLLFMLYLIFGKFYKTPLKEIEECLEKEDFSRALTIALEESKTNNSLKLRYLMLAVVAAEGLSYPQVEELERDLSQKDYSGIYLKESFYKRLAVISYLKNFPRLLLSYRNYFNLSPKSDLIPLLQKHIQTDLEWNLPQNQVEFFTILMDNFPNLLYKVNRDRVHLRQKGDREAPIVTTLSLGTKVIKRLAGQEEVIGHNRANWFYVYSETGHLGWIYGAFLKN